MLSDMEEEVQHVCELSIFADDCTAIISGSTQGEVEEKARETLKIMEEWADRWRMKISESKTEYTVITRKRKLVPQDFTLELNGVRLKYNAQPKILGDTFDPKLTWKSHIEVLVDELQPRLNLVKAVASKRWGANYETLRAFYFAFVRAKILYAAEVWGEACDTNLEKLEKIQNKALRLISGTLRSTPIEALQIECDICPVKKIIKKVALKRWTKLKYREDTHPSFRLVDVECRGSFNYKCRENLEDRGMDIPAHFPKKPTVNPRPPWNRKTPEVHTTIEKISKKEDMISSEARAAALERINTEFPHHGKIYTDGSLDQEAGHAGAGVFLPKIDRRIAIPLPPTSIAHAELVAIGRAIEEAEHMDEERIVILTDSKSSLQLIQISDPASCTIELECIHKGLEVSRKRFAFQWIPSHVNIEGNEVADSLAKMGSEMGPVNSPFTTLEKILSQIDKNFSEEWMQDWSSSIKGRSYFQLHRTRTKMNYSDMTRKDQVTISQLKSGHFPCGKYLQKVRKRDTASCLLCQEEDETIEHILFKCSRIDRGLLGAQEQLGVGVLSDRAWWGDILEAIQRWRIGHRAIAPS